MALEEAMSTTNIVVRTSPVFGEIVCRISDNSTNVMCNGTASRNSSRQTGHNVALGGGEVWGVVGVNHI